MYASIPVMGSTRRSTEIKFKSLTFTGHLRPKSNMKVKLNKKNAEVLFIAGVNTLLETALLPGAHISQVKSHCV
jgi:hypothetical protein